MCDLPKIILKCYCITTIFLFLFCIGYRYLFKKALLEDAVANADLAERKAKAAVAGNETIAPSKVIVQTDQPKRTVEEGGTEFDD